MNRNKGPRGPYNKANRRTFEQQLKDMGIDMKNMKIDPKFNSNGKTHDNGNTGPHSNPDIIVQDFSFDDIDLAIAADKSRENKRKPQFHDEKPEYVEFKGPEPTEEEKKTQEKTEYEQAEEAFKKQFEGIDGMFLIHGLEMLNGMIMPKLATRMGRMQPTKQQVLYTDQQKMLMKPGADQLMIKMLHLVKNPVVLLSIVAGSKILFTTLSNPKIQIETFNNDPNEQNE